MPSNPMAMLVDAAIAEVIRTEGGYVDHAADKGGPTKYGITLETLAAWRGRAVTASDVQALGVDEATAIYRSRYLEKPGFAAIMAAGFHKLAYVLFDWGVNSGPATAAKGLQRVLNALNNRGTRWPDLVVDGVLGRGSLAALEAYGKTFPDAEAILCELVHAIRGERFIEICEKDPTQEVFMLGWARRAVAVNNKTGA